MKNLGKPLVNELRSARSISGHGGRLAAGQGDSDDSVAQDRVSVVRRVREGLIRSGSGLEGSDEGLSDSDGSRSASTRRDLGDLVARLERLRTVLPQIAERVEFSDELKRRVLDTGFDKPSGWDTAAMDTTHWNGICGDGDGGSTSDPTDD